MAAPAAAGPGQDGGQLGAGDQQQAQPGAPGSAPAPAGTRRSACPGRGRVSARPAKTMVGRSARRSGRGARRPGRRRAAGSTVSPARPPSRSATRGSGVSTVVTPARRSAARGHGRRQHRGEPPPGPAARWRRRISAREARRQAAGPGTVGQAYSVSTVGYGRSTGIAAGAARAPRRAGGPGRAGSGRAPRPARPCDPAGTWPAAPPSSCMPGEDLRAVDDVRGHQVVLARHPMRGLGDRASHRLVGGELRDEVDDPRPGTHRGRRT